MARKGLGKGLGALLSIEEDELTAPEETTANTPAAGVEYIDIRKIEPNRNQPRQFFDDTTLSELAESIKTYGIIQPLILKDSGGYYTIIAGERRFRAARLANLESVPGIIKDYSELETLQIALIENIQRQDLTPIEEAACYKRLMDDFFFSQEDIAGKVGKNRNAIGNAVRLLELDSRVQELVSAGRITVSHARVLLTIKDGDTQFFAAEQIAEEDLSVRLAESLVLTLIQDSEDKDKSREDNLANKKEDQIKQDVHAAYKGAEDELKTILGTKVSILQGKKKGKIEIEYYSLEELDRLLGLLKRS